MFDFIVVGGLWFWAMVCAEFLFLFFCVAKWKAKDAVTWALISIAVVLCILQFASDFPILIYLWRHPLYVGYGLAIWLGFATPWAVTKWWLFVRDNSARCDEILREFLKTNGVTQACDWSVDQKMAWHDYFHNHNRLNYDDYIEYDPSTRDHKADIMAWMVLWPWSLCWTLLNDPIRKFFRHCYYFIVGRLEQIRDYYWKGKRDYMPTNAEMEAHKQAQRSQNIRTIS